MPQPGVQGGIGQIDHKVHAGEDDSEQNDDALYQRQIAVVHGVDGHVAKTLTGKPLRDNHYAADQEGERDADQSQGRQDGVGQGFAPDHAGFEIALGAGQTHIVEVHRLFQALLEKLAKGIAKAKAGKNIWDNKSLAVQSRTLMEWI